MRLELSAPIVDVTVYPDRALVTRRGEVAIPEAGEHDIVLGQLARSLERQSIRASGRGTARTRISSVDLDYEYHAAAPEQATSALQVEIDQLTRRLEELAHRHEDVVKQRGWLNTLGEQAARGLAYALIRGSAQPEDPARIFGLARTQDEQLIRELLDMKAERRRVRQEREALRRELAALNQPYDPDRLAVTIHVQAENAGTLTLEVSYQASNAGWTPRYDARVNVDAGTVRFTQQALVRQQTGEEWSGVRLALSTTRPDASVTLPEEAPVWYLEQPAPPRPMYAMRAAAPLMVGAPMVASSEAPTGALGYASESMSDYDAATVYAQVEQVGAARVFRVGGSDIPSDGLPHMVGLGDDDLNARLEYVVAPVVSSGAHLRAVTTNSTGHLLPAGALHVYHVGAAGEEYFGQTFLQSTAEDAKLLFYLGVNDNITVKRELVERDTEKGNLLQGGVRRATIGYRLTIANHTDKAQRIVALDRLPVSKHERIKVKPLEMRPQPTSQTKLDQLTWELQLAPGEEKRIEWRFLVESPADLDFVGMP